MQCTVSNYRKICNIRRTKYPNLNVSRLVLQLCLPNPMKPDVKSRMKMWLEQRWQAMLQLHLSDRQFYCPLRCVLYLETWRYVFCIMSMLNNELMKLIYPIGNATWNIKWVSSVFYKICTRFRCGFFHFGYFIILSSIITFTKTNTIRRKPFAWTSCQIREIAGCACAWNAGNVFPATVG